MRRPKEKKESVALDYIKVCGKAARVRRKAGSASVPKVYHLEEIRIFWYKFERYLRLQRMVEYVLASEEWKTRKACIDVHRLFEPFRNTAIADWKSVAVIIKQQDLIYSPGLFVSKLSEIEDRLKGCRIWAGRLFKNNHYARTWLANRRVVKDVFGRSLLYDSDND